MQKQVSADVTNELQSLHCSFSVYCPEIICKPSHDRIPHVGLIPVCHASRNVKEHLKSLKLSVGCGIGERGFNLAKLDHDIYSEADLICRRAGIFVTNPLLTVCPVHRAKLGLEFRQRVSCCFPAHSGKGKSFRGIASYHSKFILEKYGKLVPVGSGICYGCYRVLTNICKDILPDNEHSPPTEDISNIDTKDDTGQITNTRLSCLRPAVCTDHPVDADHSNEEDMLSDSQTSSQVSSWSQENMDNDLSLSELNNAMMILGQGKISPVKFRIQNEIESLRPSTLRCLKRKATESVNALLNAIAPGQGEKLLKLIEPKACVTQDSSLHILLISLYVESTDKNMKLQLLSMIADSHTKSQLQQMIPGLTIHAIDEARKHSSRFGAGASLPKAEPLKRQKMDKEKLDHALDFFFDPTFHQITAFGTKNMKLSTGLAITIPSVVRTAYHSTLVETYLSFCKETEFQPLSKSSLYKILAECPADKRTNLKGLDNIAADGGVAFDTITSIIKDVEQTFINENTELKECKEKFMSSKLYIKTEFKLHITKDSSCDDHCLSYALSDETSPKLNKICDHQHDLKCQRCEDFKEAVIKLKSIISENKDLSLEKKEDMYHDIERSERNIIEWKNHIVRSVAQDSCRQELLQNLKEGEVFIVMDWAMKFLPLMFCEKQSDWFAQKGFNWHVIVCAFKDEHGNLKHRTYVHVLDSAKQDWYSVACLLQHVLLTLKAHQPEVTTSFIRSDNAGCYHCSNLWCCIPKISENTEKNSEAHVSLMIQHEKAEFMLCTLQQGKLYQQPLDLNFTEGEEVTFFLSNNKGVVHLSGYLVEDDQFNDTDFDPMMEPSSSEEDSEEDEGWSAPELMMADEDSDDDDEDEGQTVPAGKKRKKGKEKEAVKKKKIRALIDDEAEEDNDDDDDDDDDDDIDFGDLLEGDEDDDDDEDAEIEDEEEEEEEEIKPQQKKQNKNKKTNKEEKQSPKPKESEPEQSEKKKKKKKKKKNKEANEGANSTDNTAKHKEQIKSSQKSVLAGGIVSEELKVGHGPTAQPGKMAHVYYTGKLQKSGKQFDSCTSGKPFRFRLGKGEVIKGWDTGVAGMRVGGKRRLVIPSQQGYGNSRQGPIPPGSTLVFDVELKSVS